MNLPTPAVVSQRGARRLPRVPLLLLCAAYVLPGVFGRDPWRNADLTAFAHMLALAEGRTGWAAPALGGVVGDTALLPHALGAAFIALLSPWIEPAFAARLPFALLLALTLALVWYTTFHLARTDAAQPVPFAFGGEADPVDYARAMADGALLALMATLGLLQLGHETTPELAQLCAMSLFGWALAAAPYRRGRAVLAACTALPMLAASGAPAIALAAGAAGWMACRHSRLPEVQGFARWVALAALAAALTASLADAWRWRAVPLTLTALPSIGRQWLWFLWPAWPLALWTLWRWRRLLSHRHLSVPLSLVGVAFVASVAMGGSDRALMLGLPGLASLAAFALPTLKRRASSAIDWFSMIFFTLCAVTIWVIYIAMQTGVPARTAANVARLAPGFVVRFSPWALLLAVLGTLAWVAVVRWRTGRHREALWKSLVLPAGGVALCWLLLMTLWLPLLDYARSPRAYIALLAPHVAPHLAPAGCIAAPGMSPPAVAGLEVFGRWRVDARPGRDARPACAVMLRVVRVAATRPAPPAGWTMAAEVRRPTDREEVTLVYRRAEAPR